MILAYEGPGIDETDPLYAIINYSDLGFLGVFVVEALFRILHNGFLFTNVAYLKDPWNQLDFFIVVTNLLSVVLASVSGSLANLRALRGFRALRPLRAIKKAPELRAVANLIAKTTPVFINITACALLYFLVAGTLMNKIFAVGK